MRKRAILPIGTMMLLVSMLLLLQTPLEVIAAGADCQVEITIHGQMVDEEDRSIAGQELSFRFFTGPAATDVEETIRTDHQGMFRLRTKVAQNSYESQGYQWAELQGWVLFDSEVKAIHFEPGMPQALSEPAANEEWAGAGTYRVGEIELFYNLRQAEDVEEEVEFADLFVTFGSPEEPCIFQLERSLTVTEYYLDEQGNELASPQFIKDLASGSVYTGEPPDRLQVEQTIYDYIGWTLASSQEPRQEGVPNLELTGHLAVAYIYRAEPARGALIVRHLAATTHEPVGEAEEFILSFCDLESIPLVQDTYPQPIPGQAPVWVEENQRLVREAQRRSPISGYQLVLTAEELTAQALPEAEAPPAIEIIYYYHLDRDGDGVPDYEVTEQYLSAPDERITGYEERKTIYAHRDAYLVEPPEIPGYTYLHCESEWPEESVITADTWYRYWYEQNSTATKPGGGGNKDKGQEIPPTEAEPPPPDDRNGPEEATADNDRNEEESEFIEEIPAEAPATEPDEAAVEAPSMPEESAATTTGASTAGRTQPADSPLSATEREERRNITFVKRSLRQQVGPGEEVSYSFTGFENAFPYELTDFTIIDEPDPGLDFTALDLPAFQEGATVTYNVTYSTSRRPAEQSLAVNQPADQPLQLTAPQLTEREHVTAVYIRMGTVPPGFGVGNEVEITFRVWEEPPQDTLHNLGALFYKELEEPVECLSDDDKSTVLIDLLGSFGHTSWAEGPGDGVGPPGSGGATLSSLTNAIWEYGIWLLLAALLTTALRLQRRYLKQ